MTVRFFHSGHETDSLPCPLAPLPVEKEKGQLVWKPAQVRNPKRGFRPPCSHSSCLRLQGPKFTLYPNLLPGNDLALIGTEGSKHRIVESLRQISQSP